MGEAPLVVSASRNSMLPPTNLSPRKRKNLLQQLWRTQRSPTLSLATCARKRGLSALGKWTKAQVAILAEEQR
jgi:hypothetical protein